MMNSSFSSATAATGGSSSAAGSVTHIVHHLHNNNPHHHNGPATPLQSSSVHSHHSVGSSSKGGKCRSANGTHAIGSRRLVWYGVCIFTAFASLLMWLLSASSWDAAPLSSARKANVRSEDHTSATTASWPVRFEGTFRGGASWRSAKTIHAEPVLETPWIRVEDHTVAVRGPGGVVSHVTGWKWVDIPDQVNVLVSISYATLRQLRSKKAAGALSTTAGIPLLATEVDNPASSEESGIHHGDSSESSPLFLLFRQEKYGIEGESYAVVGGQIEPHEAAAAAAAREVREEMGLIGCELVPLGTYRTDVNRGGGFVNTFLARRCVADETSKPQDASRDADLEQQVPVAVTQAYLTRLLVEEQSGAVKEVKWCNTIAMSLLWLSSHRQN